jgi:hypothetical protein
MSTSITEGKIDKIYYDDPSVLYRDTRYLEFFVSSDMTDIEKMNSIARFGIYAGILLSLYKQKYGYLSIMLMTFGFTYFIYNFSLKKRDCSRFEVDTGNISIEDRLNHTIPTVSNPLMNTSVVEFGMPGGKLPALPYPDKSEKSKNVMNEIEKKFSEHTFEDYTDIYQKGGSRRQFYTMPSEFTANDTKGEFMDFLYGDLKSGKENRYENVKNNYTPLQNSSNIN